MLTRLTRANILKPLSAHLEGGRGNPNTSGFNKPLSNAVFFCHSKTTAIFNRLYSVMAGLFRELERVAVPEAVFPPLFNPAAYVVENISSGLHPKNSGVTAMSQSRSFSDELLKVLSELKSEIQALKNEIRALKDNAAVISEPVYSNETSEVKAEIANALGIKAHELPAQLSPAQTAKVLKVKPATLSVWRCLGNHKLPVIKTGKSPFYRLKDIIAFMQDRYYAHTGLKVAGGVA